MRYHLWTTSEATAQRAFARVPLRGRLTAVRSGYFDATGALKLLSTPIPPAGGLGYRLSVAFAGLGAAERRLRVHATTVYEWSDHGGDGALVGIWVTLESPTRYAQRIAADLRRSGFVDLHAADGVPAPILALVGKRVPSGSSQLTSTGTMENH